MIMEKINRKSFHGNKNNKIKQNKTSATTISLDYNEKHPRKETTLIYKHSYRAWYQARLNPAFRTAFKMRVN